MNFSLNFRKDLLINTPDLPCCIESFLVAYSTGKPENPDIRIKKYFRAQFKKLVEKNPGKYAIKWKGCRAEIQNFDLLKAREKFVKRVNRLSAGSSSTHCLIAFMHGLIFGKSYFQNPEVGYHFEIRLKGKWKIAALKKVVRLLKLPFKFYQKKKVMVAYVKSRQKISSILGKLNCFDFSMEMLDIIATKKILGLVNRQVNFETANINRTISAAEQSIEECKQLLNYHDQEIWSDNLRFTAIERVKNPHDSLEKLGKRFNPPLSKSAINHRIRRIKALYRRLFIIKSNKK